MIAPKTAAKLRAINEVGLTRLAARARENNRLDVERDMRVLRAIACGTTGQAAERLHMSASTVRDILDRYARLARAILAEDKMRGGNAK